MTGRQNKFSPGFSPGYIKQDKLISPREGGGVTVRLKERVAIVTGGARGLGRAYSLGLAGEGARVVVADIDLAGAQAVVNEIEAEGGQGLALETDVAQKESSLEMARRAGEKFGRIDILINNAALYARLSALPFDKTSVEEWDQVMAVNLRGMFLCCQAVFPWMKRAGRGKIINISSGTIWIGGNCRIHYTTSKAGVIGFTRSLARELGRLNICVNCVTPGLTDTEAARMVQPQAVQDEVAKLRCFKRREVPQDMVGTIIFLCSDESDFITGQTVNVDGGMSMH